MDDNIFQLDALRIKRQEKRKCVCDERDKKFTIDTVNREITCECGIVTDPFEAIMSVAKTYERINEQHQAMDQQRREWLRQKPHSVLFKELEKHYRRGEMLPYCPVCDHLIELDKLSAWGNAKFYLERQRAILAERAKESATDPAP